MIEPKRPFLYFAISFVVLLMALPASYAQQLDILLKGGHLIDPKMASIDQWILALLMEK